MPRSGRSPRIPERPLISLSRILPVINASLPFNCSGPLVGRKASTTGHPRSTRLTNGWYFLQRSSVSRPERATWLKAALSFGRGSLPFPNPQRHGAYGPQTPAIPEY
jgi:hypothetical protein